MSEDESTFGLDNQGPNDPGDDDDIIPADNQLEASGIVGEVGGEEGVIPDEDEEVIPPDWILRPPVVNVEQLLYARILETGMYIGLAMLLLTFALYASGIVSPAIPIEELPGYWEMGVHEYLEATNHDHLHREQLMTGWAWISVLGKGDYLNFLPIAVLSGVTVICYLGIVPTLIRQKDRAYALMALVEVVILLLAASGLLAVGH